MLTYQNIQRYDNMPFEDYLNVVGVDSDRTFSHSFLKSEQNGVSPLFIPSNKVKIGAMVDAILTSPETVDPSQPFFKEGCRIASKIKAKHGDLIKHFTPQVSYTGQISYKGLVMNTCGRLDWLLENIAVIDLKVTEAKSDSEFEKIISFMGYRNQMFNYMNLSGTKESYILPYSTKTNDCLTIVPIKWSLGANEFWQNAVLKFGK